MLGTTHLAGAAAAGLAVSTGLGLELPEVAVLAGGSLLTAKLPDVDRSENAGPNHRALPHSLLLAGGAVLAGTLVGASYLSSAAAPPAAEGLLASVEVAPELTARASALVEAGYASAAVAGLGTGYLSHLVLDALTPARIWLLFPGGSKVGYPLLARVGDAREALVRWALVILSGLLVLGVWG
ncbi:MAG: metal-dependent hydrolase [Acidobacteria bacterium]|nr:metal-dependent hydrolase [Acidobacteriota bacterium]